MVVTSEVPRARVPNFPNLRPVREPRINKVVGLLIDTFDYF